MQLTQHFTLQEFACHDGTAYPSEWIQERLLPLCTALEAIRTACGNSGVKIISGYRTPAHNSGVGGAKKSQHMEGRAADISVSGVAPDEVHFHALQLFKSGAIKIGGLGLYNSWVHVDVRPLGTHLAQWTGSKVGDEQT